MKTDMNGWAKKAESAVQKAKLLAISNPEKLDKAVDFFIDAADKALFFKNPIWEVISDAALRKILRPLIMSYINTTYKKMKAKGEI